MKSLILFPTILLFFVFPSINSISQVNLGLKSGLDISSLHFDQNDFGMMVNGFNPIASFHIGACSDIFFSEKISLLLEVLYSVKGGKNNSDFGMPSSPDDLTSRIKYLSIPVLFNYHLRNISFEIGPEFAYEISTKNIINDQKPIIELWDANFDIELDYGIKYHVERMNFGVRYSQGLIDISSGLTFADSNGDPVNNPPRFLNRMVQFSVGFDLLQKNSSKKEDE